MSLPKQLHTEVAQTQQLASAACFWQPQTTCQASSNQTSSPQPHAQPCRLGSPGSPRRAGPPRVPPAMPTWPSSATRATSQRDSKRQGGTRRRAAYWLGEPRMLSGPRAAVSLPQHSGAVQSCQNPPKDKKQEGLPGRTSTSATSISNKRFFTKYHREKKSIANLSFDEGLKNISTRT